MHSLHLAGRTTESHIQTSSEKVAVKTAVVCADEYSSLQSQEHVGASLVMNWGYN